MTIRLTPKQLKILELISEGKSNKEIAGILGISYQTVRNAVRLLKLKLRKNRVQMAIWYREGMKDYDVKEGRSNERVWKDRYKQD